MNTLVASPSLEARATRSWITPVEIALLGAVWGASLALGEVCTGIAFVMYYRLIARVGASRASTVTYLVPLFGVAWAWMLLGEAVTPTMLASGALILGSVAFSQRAK